MPRSTTLAVRLAIVGALAAGTGCGRGARPVAYAGAAAATALGVYMLSDSMHSHCGAENFGCTLAEPVSAGFEAGAGTALTIAGGAVLLALIATHEPAEIPEPVAPPPELDLTPATLARVSAAPTTAPTPAPLPEPRTSDPYLRQLTLQAVTLARAGHCDAVRVTASSVADRDPDYRIRGFVADAAIADCLTE